MEEPFIEGSVQEKQEAKGYFNSFFFFLVK